MKRLLLFCLPFVILGCGDSGGPDQKVETARVSSAKDMRSYFDRAGGDYSKLSEADRASFLQLVGGSEENAQKAWNAMKSGGAASASGPTTSP
jgi:hypothetical protein